MSKMNIIKNCCVYVYMILKINYRLSHFYEIKRSPRDNGSPLIYFNIVYLIVRCILWKYVATLVAFFPVPADFIINSLYMFDFCSPFKSCIHLYLHQVA